MKFLYVVTHQIQAHTPLFRKISQNKKVSFKAIYWQNISKNYFDTEFNRIINWGMDLTSGFNYFFLFDKETDIFKNNLHNVSYWHWDTVNNYDSWQTEYINKLPGKTFFFVSNIPQ